jgi:hypothetical protein
MMAAHEALSQALLKCVEIDARFEPTKFLA